MAMLLPRTGVAPYFSVLSTQKEAALLDYAGEIAITVAAPSRLDIAVFKELTDKKYT